MKKILILLTCLGLFYSQNLSVGIYAGSNIINTLENEKTFTEPFSTPSLLGGLAVSYKLSEKVSVGASFLWDLKRVRREVRNLGYKDLQRYRNMNLFSNYLYLTIEPEIHYTASLGLIVTAGFFYSLKISSDREVATRKAFLGGGVEDNIWANKARISMDEENFSKDYTVAKGIYGLSFSFSYPIEVMYNTSVMPQIGYSFALSDALEAKDTYVGREDAFKSIFRNVRLGAVISVNL